MKRKLPILYTKPPALEPVEATAPEAAPALRAPSALRRASRRFAAWWQGGAGDGQRRAAGYLVRFLALVLLFTLLARGTAGATLAEVDTAAPASGEIEEATRGAGQVKSAGELGVEVPEGLRFEEVLVTQGEQVAEGDPLARFSGEDLSERLAREQAALEELRAKKQSLERSTAPAVDETTGARQSLSWAEQDLASAQAGGQKAIQQADAAAEAARKALEKAKEARQALPADADAEAKQAAKQAVGEAEAALGEAQKTAGDARVQAEQGEAEARRQAETARQALDTAQKNDAKTQQEAADTAAGNRAQAGITALDITAKEKDIAELEALIAAGGALPAPAAGLVLSCPEAGAQAGAEPAFTLADSRQGYVAEVLLDKKAAEALTPGIECDVAASTSSYYNETYTATLLALGEPDASGMVKATLRLPEGSWKEGQAVDVRFVQSKNQYQQCVPLSALRVSDGGYYVLVMEESQSVLGTEHTLRSVAVELLAKDESYAAVEGPLGPDTRVITGSTKPVEAGHKVRERAA